MHPTKGRPPSITTKTELNIKVFRAAGKMFMKEEQLGDKNVTTLYAPMSKELSAMQDALELVKQLCSKDVEDFVRENDGGKCLAVLTLTRVKQVMSVSTVLPIEIQVPYLQFILAWQIRAWPRIRIHVICLGYFLQKRPTFCRKVAKETYKI